MKRSSSAAAPWSWSVLGVLFFCVCAAAAHAQTTYGPTHQWTTGNGHFYALTDQAFSWQEANRFAIESDGHLVSILDEAEMRFLAESIGGTEWYWIGLNDASTENLFEWSSGEAFSYQNWGWGEPNNSSWAFLFNDMPYDEDFVMTNFGGTGIWNDMPEFTRVRAIIEFDSDPRSGSAGFGAASVAPEGDAAAMLVMGLLPIAGLLHARRHFHRRHRSF